MMTVIATETPAGETALEERERRAGLAIARCDVPRDLQQMLQLAEVMANARVVPRHFQRLEDMVVLFMAAQALDVPAFWATQAFHLVEGKLGMEATFMRALLYRAGGGFKILEHTRQRAVAQIRRPGEKDWCDPVVREYAEYAHLHGKVNWKNSPRDMLMARVTTTGMRLYTPGVLMGFNYSPDELEEDSAPKITVALRPAVRPAATGAEAWLKAIADASHLDQINDLWKRAGNRLDEPIDGISLRDRLMTRGREITEEMKRRADAENADVDGEVDPDDVRDGEIADVVDAEDVEEPAQDLAHMSCGCPTDLVFETGNHDPRCSHYTPPAPVDDPRGGRR